MIVKDLLEVSLEGRSMFLQALRLGQRVLDSVPFGHLDPQPAVTETARVCCIEGLVPGAII